MSKSLTIAEQCRGAQHVAANRCAGSAPIEALTIGAALPTHTRFVELQQRSSDRPGLQSARRVVSGGCGVGSKENFEIIYTLTDKLAGRPDRQGHRPPELYLAIGISGAIQHLTGIKDAELPIFEIADIGLVRDLFQLLPELEASL